MVHFPAMIAFHDASPRVVDASLHPLASLLEDLIEAGGPMPEQYAALNRQIRQTGDLVRAQVLPRELVRDFVRELTEEHFAGTMQAQALRQQHGYSGDFQIIDDIYTLRVSDDPALRRWDLFFQAQAAPCAVRNRKSWFLKVLGKRLESAASSVRGIRVLNVASGPARDVREWFLEHPSSGVHIDCVDMDANAIEHAKGLCSHCLDRVRFHRRNVLRFVPGEAYDLVWSAGLFDYLSDKVFVHLLKALMAVTRPGGEVVVGNFSDFNPSRDYMELLGDWHLHHRNREHLLRLAQQAGAVPGSLEILWEPEGVNLFLHIRR